MVVSEGRAGERAEGTEELDEGPSTVARIATLAALIGLVVLAYLVLFKSDPYRVTATFANAGQVVKGNEVVVGGAHAGSVKEIELGPQGQALVTFTVDDEYAPLARGTVATVRSPSLSQIAGRQVQLTLPADGTEGPAIADGGTLDQAETVSDWSSVPPLGISSPAWESAGGVSWTWRPAICDSDGERIVATVPR